MGKFDELFEFRMAKVDEIDKIMEFCRKYWGNENHILAVNRPFFEYEFRKGDRLGYFLAIEKETGNIAAAEGVYFYSADHVPGKSDISSGMLLANPECRVPFIGVELLKRMAEQLEPRAYVAAGLNMSTAGPLFQRVLHYDVRRMKHFYILSDRQEYKIAIIQKKTAKRVMEKAQVGLTAVKTAEELYRIFDDSAFQTRKPYKDKWYVTHRYFEHPVYEYQVFLAGNRTAIVGRELDVDGAKIFRIVDILGEVNTVASLGGEFERLMGENDYEYIDLYELGMEDEILLSAGFTERVENDVNIIPNYFEPYERRNIENYVVRLDTESLCFKADGDQDRPNYAR